MKDTLYACLPKEVKAILLVSEGWLVGKAPKNIIDKKNPNDYDIIVPSRELFLKTIQVCNKTVNTSTNTFGGIKLMYLNDVSIDIWCETLDSAFKTHKHIPYAYNMKRNVLLKSH